ncbi:hypothetical protein ACFLT7_07645, partial [candidate division KSB1 bacterium]
GYYLAAANDQNRLMIGLAVYHDSTWDTPPDPGRFTIWIDPGGGKRKSIGLNWPGERGNDEVLWFVEDQLAFWEAVPSSEKWEFDRRRREAGPPWMLIVRDVSRPVWPEPEKNGFEVQREKSDSLYITTITIPLNNPHYRIRPRADGRISVGLDMSRFRGRSRFGRSTRSDPYGMDQRQANREQFRRAPEIDVAWFDLYLDGVAGSAVDEDKQRIIRDYLLLRSRRTGRLTWERRKGTDAGYGISTPPPVSAQVVVADSTLIEAGLRWYSDLLELEPEEQKVFGTAYKRELPQGWQLIVDLNMSTTMNPVFLEPDRWTFFVEKDKFFRWEPTRVDSTPIRTLQPTPLAGRNMSAAAPDADPLVANFGRAGFSLTPHLRSFRLIFTGLPLEPGQLTLVAMPTNNPGFRLSLPIKWPDIKIR